jgi:hypothetical protein
MLARTSWSAIIKIRRIVWKSINILERRSLFPKGALTTRYIGPNKRTPAVKLRPVWPSLQNNRGLRGG